MAGFNMSQQQLDALLKQASQSLGVREDQLRQSLEKGDYSNYLDEKNAGLIQNFLSSPGMVENLLQLPGVKSFLDKMNQG